MSEIQTFTVLSFCRQGCKMKNGRVRCLALACYKKMNIARLRETGPVMLLWMNLARLRETIQAKVLD